jgi:hypothetical protein
MKRTYALSLVAALLVCAAGCSRKAPDAGRLEVQPHAVTLPYPQLTTIHLTWTPAAPPGSGDTPSQPLVFLHLLGAKGEVVRTFDHPFPQRWLEGAPVPYDVKLYQSALAPPLDPGKYRLSVGLYDHNGKRWALEGLGEPIGRQEYLAAEVEVPPQPAGPRLAFSPAWLPLEAGSDKQVVARRWLAPQPGEIRVESPPGPGTLWLSFRIPPGDGANEKVVYHDASANTPGAVVRDSCGGVETGISGPGPHGVEMPVAPPGPPPAGPPAQPDNACRISVIPNFHIVATEVPPPHPPRSLALDNAAWIPAAGNPAGRP